MTAAPSQRLASNILEWCRTQGVESYVVCGGSRNSPILAQLAHSTGAPVFHHFEERSAGFFALGRSRRYRRPAAVITTSGTAAAELLPAIVEAHHQRLPLVAITADRPRRFRGTGAPQSILQTGIFGGFVENCIDLEPGESPPPTWSHRLPIHLNPCFDEPLLTLTPERMDLSPHFPTTVTPAVPDEAVSAIESFLAAARTPLILVSTLDPSERPSVLEFVHRMGCLAYLEGVSGLREHPSLTPLRIQSGDRFLASAGFDAVLRIGGVPTGRYWRELDSQFSHVKVLSIDPRGWSGLARGSVLPYSPGPWLSRISPQGHRHADDLLSRDARLHREILEILRDEPHSEPGMIHQFSRRLPARNQLFLGNSLAIREWDLVAEPAAACHSVFANRGANGIDGEISSFLGLADPAVENWALLGDLTALYDLAGPWIARQLPETRLRIVIVHNGGGRIFSRLPGLRSHLDPAAREQLFENSHNLDFSGWASLWGFDHHRITSSTGWPSSSTLADRCILELRPDPDATARFWDRYDALWTRCL